MKIAVCQFPNHHLAVSASYKMHESFINQILSKSKVDVVFFPELSLSGYFSQHENITAVVRECESYAEKFHQIACDNNLVLAIGMPLFKSDNPMIGMKVFNGIQNQMYEYSKQLLHSSESSFFASGNEQLLIKIQGHVMAPAICFESKQIQHTENALKLGATIYIACVAEDEESLMNRSFPHYLEYSKMFPILLANCIGDVNGGEFIGHGWVSVFRNGQCLERLDSLRAGWIVYDTEGGSAESFYIQEVVVQKS
jgi:predicted amidohydrolase